MVKGKIKALRVLMRTFSVRERDREREFVLNVPSMANAIWRQAHGHLTDWMSR